MTRILFIALLALFLPTAGIGQDANGAIRVLSFNIRYDEPRDGVNAWPNRINKVAGVISFHKADIVGLQEAKFNQVRDLEKALPSMAWYGVGRDDGKEGGESCAILFRRSRFQMIDSGTSWLSEKPDVVGSKSWDAVITRIVSWVKLRDRTTRKTLFVFNTHFDHIGQTARVNSASLIVEKIARLAGKTPFVLTGDFNVERSNDAYKTIVAGKPGVPIDDARSASVTGHFGSDSTWNAFKELQPGRTIDFVFVKRGVRVLQHAALADRFENGLWASDHLPVLAEIVLP